ncbi:growth-regulating factor 1-like [Cucurbita pepo subsp. pepo]|uniref:growth-regulating factor 1-like n=1 Tax=Cucurbita pepo subsp. pepo TaxID=3664 RepID=UPI000C9D31E6|nr:growth-regulating factor 1-like [Cucurbita pepo subsp. pepo]
MDFGVVGLDSFVDSSDAPSPYPETKLKSLGSAFSKQDRSGFVDDDDWSNSKIPKTDTTLSASKTMPLHQGFPLLRSNALLSTDGRQKEHMLSFSSLKSDTSLQTKDSELIARSLQTSIYPYHQHKSSPYSRNTGCVSGSYSGSMHGAVAGIRAPFTQSQWIELEHQALIYKYLSSNVPVPSNLLIPLKKSLYPYGLTCSSAGSLPPNTRWGSFHLGFSGNTDPEPGRCRRTDGKKWRCSRDAVADQKYCERHINRGRHRSRKPVEGQTGHSVPGTTNPTAMVATMTTSLSSTVMPSGGASNNNLPIIQHQHQLKSLHPGAASNPGVDAPVNRLLNKETVCSRIQEPGGLSMISSTVNLMSSSDKSGAKHEISLGESTQSEFGLVSTDSLLNPSQRGSYANPKNFDSFLIFNDQETQDQDQHPLRQFCEDWPKDQSSRSVMTWPEEFKSDWTQLSMSIPMSNFSSSSSSPTQEKLVQSPLRLSKEEVEPMEMNLGVSRNDGEVAQKQMSWGGSMGGPLGEALTNANSCVKGSKVPPSLNLLAEGWDGGQLGSSPTGVLQKATFCSLSNSS